MSAREIAVEIPGTDADRRIISGAVDPIPPRTEVGERWHETAADRADVEQAVSRYI